MHLCRDIRKLLPCDVLLDERRLRFREVPRIDVACAPEEGGDMAALAARCRTYIDDLIARLRIGFEADLLGGIVLDRDLAAPEGLAVHDIALHLFTVSVLETDEVLLFTLEEPGQHALGFLPSIDLLQCIVHPERHTVADIGRCLAGMREVLEDDLLIPGNTPEHAVYEAAQEEDLILLALHELDRLVDGRTVRHLIHVEDLVAAHAEHRPDQRLHVFRMGLTELIQDKVDLNRVLKGSLDEPRHEGTVARGPVRIRRQCIA